MLFTLLFTMIFSRCKGLRLSPVLRLWPIYPFLLAECVYYFFQLNTFFGNYSYIVYAHTLKTALMLTMLFPVFFLRIYRPALWASGFAVLGTMLNNLVIHANSGKMPVFPTLSLKTGYFNSAALNTIDSLHVLGSSATKLKFLSDYIDTGTSILSIGDLIIRLFFIIILYYTIKKANIKI